MVETSGIVAESESVLPGSQMTPPERSDLPCRYASGSGFWSGLSNGWFIAEHDEGMVLFCSGAREVGTEVSMWVHPSDASNGRLLAPTFTVPEAILSLVVTFLAAAGLMWAWGKLR